MITDADLDAPMTLQIVGWEEFVRCVYLNQFLIAGKIKQTAWS